MAERNILEIQWFSPEEVAQFPPGMLKKTPSFTRVADRYDFNGDLIKIYFEKPCGFHFKPGQYCTIGQCARVKYEKDGIEKEQYEIVWRPYSIVSAPHETHIELFVELTPEKYRRPDSLAPQICKLGPNEAIFILPGAKGLFLFEEDYARHLMVATVTGVAPFMSMIRAKAHEDIRDDKKLYVMYGASCQDDFGSYLQELEEYRATGVVADFVAAVSRPHEERNKGWIGEKRRVNLLVEEYVDAWGLSPENTMCYVCGNEGMIDDLANEKTTEEKPLGKLIKRGYRTKKEIYF